MMKLYPLTFFISENVCFYVSDSAAPDFVNPYTGKKIKGPFLVN